MRGILGRKKKGMSEKMDAHLRLERAGLLFWWGLEMAHLSGGEKGSSIRVERVKVM